MFSYWSTPATGLLRFIDPNLMCDSYSVHNYSWKVIIPLSNLSRVLLLLSPSPPPLFLSLVLKDSKFSSWSAPRLWPHHDQRPPLFLMLKCCKILLFWLIYFFLWYIVFALKQKKTFNNSHGVKTGRWVPLHEKITPFKNYTDTTRNDHSVTFPVFTHVQYEDDLTGNDSF